jgi:nucleoside-diphosphate-sugar epimerase
MSTLVAGGSGFIGFHLVKRLAELGERVIIFDSQPPPPLPQDRSAGVTWVKGDATQMVDILHALRDHEVRDVYHLVALLANVCQEKPHLALKINVESLVNFLEAARILNLGRVIFASSVAVYSPHDPAPVGEEASTNPASVYGATKVLGEFYGLHYHRSWGVDFRALRFTTLYGLGKTGGSTGICSLMIEKAARGEPVSGDVREAVTDWLYVKDAVKSLLLAREIKNPKHRVYNVGGGSYSVGQVADLVRKYLPAAKIHLAAKRTFPWPPSYQWKRAEEELGYTPLFDIDKGVQDFISEAEKSGPAR